MLPEDPIYVPALATTRRGHCTEAWKLKKSITRGGVMKPWMWLLMSMLEESCTWHQIVIVEHVGGDVMRSNMEPKTKAPRLNLPGDMRWSMEPR